MEQQSTSKVDIHKSILSKKSVRESQPLREFDFESSKSLLEKTQNASTSPNDGSPPSNEQPIKRLKKTKSSSTKSKSFKKSSKASKEKNKQTKYVPHILDVGKHLTFSASSAQTRFTKHIVCHLMLCESYVTHMFILMIFLILLQLLKLRVGRNLCLT